METAVGQKVPGVGLSARIENAFRAASSATGVGFDYLLATAQRESSLDPTAKAKTSSATGLFQFIESTWLETVKDNGADFGLKDFSDAITRLSDGSLQVRDQATKEAILSLRKDPVISAQMAGAFTRDNAEQLEQKIGRRASEGELYIAHFLGARGGGDLILTATHAPELPAAEIYPRQAEANRAIFFNKDGSALTVSEVYANLVRHHSDSVSEIASLPTAAPKDAVITAQVENFDDDVLASHFGVARSAYANEPVRKVPAFFNALDEEDTLFDARAARLNLVDDGSAEARPGALAPNPDTAFENIQPSATALTSPRLAEPLPLIPLREVGVSDNKTIPALNNKRPVWQKEGQPLDLALFLVQRLNTEGF